MFIPVAIGVIGHAKKQFRLGFVGFFCLVWQWLASGALPDNSICDGKVN